MGDRYMNPDGGQLLRRQRLQIRHEPDVSRRTLVRVVTSFEIPCPRVRHCRALVDQLRERADAEMLSDHRQRLCSGHRYRPFIRRDEASLARTLEVKHARGGNDRDPIHRGMDKGTVDAIDRGD